MTAIFAAVLLAAATSWFLTRSVLAYAVASHLLDIPNARSAHRTPTPRGGGAAIVVTSTVLMIVLAALGQADSRVVTACVVGGLPVAFVGWLDDRRGLTPWTRLAVHGIAALAALQILGGLPRIAVPTTVVEMGQGGFLLGLFGIVAATNIYNFMDGIDAIAGAESAFVGLVGGVLSLLAGAPELASIALVMGAASAGFLAWNWPPARIFMGDVGSGYLGFVLAVLAIGSEHAAGLPLLGWIVLLGVFAFDGTATIIRRAAGGRAIWQAHNDHAYQRAVQSGYSQPEVLCAVMVINVGLALCAAVIATRGSWAAAAFLSAGLILTGAYLAAEWIFRTRQRPRTTKGHGLG